MKNPPFDSLVWGSLRLAPITSARTPFAATRHKPQTPYVLPSRIMQPQYVLKVDKIRPSTSQDASELCCEEGITHQDTVRAKNTSCVQKLRCGGRTAILRGQARRWLYLQPLGDLRKRGDREGFHGVPFDGGRPQG